MPTEVHVGQDTTAGEVLRDRLNLTGTKLACGSGACGACTIHLDDEPVVSCLLPAVALQGRSVKTVEGLPAELHAVQRALMAHDGLQCGYCTPGFVMEGVAFYDRWRAKHGPDADGHPDNLFPRPSRAAVMAGLAGHLCRCGAYPGIIEAIADACAGRFDTGDAPAGERIEAKEKVSGRARYTVDVRLEDQLVGRILRSKHPHARIVSVDGSAALAMEGVHAFVDLLDDRRHVQYIGQEIAAVAAVDKSTVDRALAAIVVEYETYPATIGMNAAMEPDSPIVHSGLRKHHPSSAEGPMTPSRWKGNLRGPVSAMSVFPGKARRRIKAARAAGGERLVEGTWKTAVQVHTSLEPHACVAHWEGDRLTAYISSQACARVADEIMEHYDLAPENVQVISEHVGGGFGAKLELTMEAISAIDLARVAGRPVAVFLNREEELMVGGYRPGSKIELAMTASEEGALDALQVKAYGDGGIAPGSTVASLFRFIYPKAPKALTDYDVVSHLPPGKPFRGPGAPNAAWALEQAVDEMAEKLDVDPVELRRRWDPNPLRNALMDWVETIPEWRDRAPAASDQGRYRRGIGMAIANWMYFLQPNVEVEVSAGPDGFGAACGVQDMGTGSRTVIARAVAEVFDIQPSQVNVRIGDSTLPQGPMSGGSRTTASIRPAALDAAAELGSNIAQAAAEHFGLLEARAGKKGVEHSAGTVPWLEAIAVLPHLAVTAGRGPDKTRFFLPVNIEGLRTGRGFTRAVHVSQVEVDTQLGKIRVDHVWGWHRLRQDRGASPRQKPSVRCGRPRGRLRTLRGEAHRSAYRHDAERGPGGLQNSGHLGHTGDRYRVHPDRL